MKLQLLPLVVLAAWYSCLRGDAFAKEAPPFPSAETDIWVLAGQSNMQGSALITREYRPHPRVIVYDLQNHWVPAVPPTHRVFTAVAPVFKRTILENNPKLTDEVWSKLQADDRKTPVGGLGPDISFAESIVEATGRHVVLLPCALGGTTLAQWNPAKKDEGTSSLYGNMMVRIAQLGGRIKGILWYQGEGQTGSPETSESFESDFLNFVDCVRRDLSEPELPFLYVQIARFCLSSKAGEPRWKAVQEKQRILAGQRRSLWVVPAVDLDLDDLIHVGESGQLRLGKRLAEVALTHVYQVPGHGTSIDFAGVEVLKSQDSLHHCLRVKFAGVSGRLQAQGRIAGFAIESDDAEQDAPMVYKIEVDANDPTSVLVWYTKELSRPVRLTYGLGLDVYANLTDSRDMAVPAFGPVVVHPLEPAHK